MKEKETAAEIFAISEGIADFLGGENDAEKQKDLHKWIDEDINNKELFDKICSQENISTKIRQYKNNNSDKAFEAFIAKRKKKSIRKNVYRLLSSAAVILLSFGIWTLIQIHQDKTLMTDNQTLLVKSIAKNNPILTLPDGERINITENDLSFIETKNGQQLVMGDSVYSAEKDNNKMESYNTLEVPNMCNFNFTLSDGTKVWMNAASSLKYPIKFSSDSRIIYASGEIYLEVAKDSKRPFTVVIDNMKINVLGTSFNIRAYPNENNTKVTLAQGRINAEIGNKKYVLSPGKQLGLEQNFGAVTIKDVDVSDVISWKDGYYVFKKCRLSEVASTLQNWYGVHIMMTSDISANLYYTGVVNKNESIEVFLKRLEEVSNVKCQISGKYISIY